VVSEDGDDKRLIAYLVPTIGAHPSPAQMRNSLLQMLPEYMIPAAFVPIDKMPITSNGKLDRNALPAPDLAERSTEEVVRPETPTQVRLAALWEPLLKVNNVGIHESFFDLGGHSILAAKLMAQIRSSFGIHLAFHNIFRAPTISRLAALIDAKLETQSPLQAGETAAGASPR
jgi:acyl carrier protein